MMWRLLLTPALSLAVAQAQGQNQCGTDKGNQLRNCEGQAACSNFTASCTTADLPENCTCAFKICMNIRANSSDGDTCQGDSISHYCNRTDQCPAPTLPVFLKNDTTEVNDPQLPLEYCQFGQPNETLYFIVKAAQGCNCPGASGNTMATEEVEFPDFPQLQSNASCRPSRVNETVGSCTGNPAGEECVWAVKVPQECPCGTSTATTSRLTTTDTSASSTPSSTTSLSTTDTSASSTSPSTTSLSTTDTSASSTSPSTPSLTTTVKDKKCRKLHFYCWKICRGLFAPGCGRWWSCLGSCGKHFKGVGAAMLGFCDGSCAAQSTVETSLLQRRSSRGGDEQEARALSPPGASSAVEASPRSAAASEQGCQSEPSCTQLCEALAKNARSFSACFKACERKFAVVKKIFAVYCQHGVCDPKRKTFVSNWTQEILDWAEVHFPEEMP